jgi:hypothetical protein
LQKALSIAFSLNERFHAINAMLNVFYDTTDERLVFSINALDLLECSRSNEAVMDRAFSPSLPGAITAWGFAPGMHRTTRSQGLKARSMEF